MGTMPVRSRYKSITMDSQLESRSMLNIELYPKWQPLSPRARAWQTT